MGMLRGRTYVAVLLAGLNRTSIALSAAPPASGTTVSCPADRTGPGSLVKATRSTAPPGTGVTDWTAAWEPPSEMAATAGASDAGTYAASNDGRSSTVSVPSTSASPKAARLMTADAAPAGMVTTPVSAA